MKSIIRIRLLVVALMLLFSGLINSSCKKDDYGVPDLPGTTWKSYDVGHIPQMEYLAGRFFQSNEFKAYSKLQNQNERLDWQGTYELDKNNLSVTRPGVATYTGIIKGDKLDIRIDGRDYVFHRQ